MFAIIFLAWITGFVLFQWARMGFPLSPALVFVAIWQAIKGAYYFAVTQSFWVVAWYALLVLSLDIVTPPYFIDVEYMLAAPIAIFIKEHWGLSIWWSGAIAFGAVFVAASIVIVAHFMFVRKIIKKN
jgi:hypothetical protein